MVALDVEQAWRALSRQPIPPAYLSSLHPSPSTSSPSTPFPSTSSPSPSSSREYPIGGAHLTYTPMIHARLLVEREVGQGKMDNEVFDRVQGEFERLAKGVGEGGGEGLDEEL